MDRIFNMILRQITRRLVNKGINAGIKKASSARGSKPGQEAAPGQPRQSTRQIKQAAKMLRRTTRM